jgi:hypothetical protein
MQGPFLRKYGEATTLDFVLYSTDGTSLKTDAVHASGDATTMKDEGVEANTTNGFVDEGKGYSLALTATEMQAARIVIYLVDQTSPKAWLDEAIVVETYGHTSAQHAFDLDTATQSVVVSDKSGFSLSAAGVDAVHDEVVEGSLTLRQVARLLLAALAGKSGGGGTTTVNFRDNADSKNRITATVDSNGNRTAVTLDGS